MIRNMIAKDGVVKIHYDVDQRTDLLLNEALEEIDRCEAVEVVLFVPPKQNLLRFLKHIEQKNYKIKVRYI